MFSALLPLVMLPTLGQNAAQTTGVSVYDRPLPWSSNVGPGVPEFWVRPGYKVTLVAEKLANARFMVLDGKGNLFMSRPDRGDIIRLTKKGDRYENAGTFVKGYKTVHGMDIHDGWLWFTQSGAIFKTKINDDGSAGTVETVLDGLPNGGHWWRPILVVKDGFFTGIGDPGNLTDQRQTDREKIWKYSLDGKTRTLWSSGIRNTEKYMFRPGTEDLYGADHGSDWYGGKLGEGENKPQPVTDAYPPCEFNRYVEGGFYGHPFFVGQNVPRLEFTDRPDMDEIAKTAIPPVWPLGPHWAPNGWTFATKDKTVNAGDAVIACHGSWNRSVKSGYRVEQVLFDKATGQPYGSLMLVGELGKTGDVLGRPVDVVEESNGDLLFSDDGTNSIYRISKVK